MVQNYLEKGISLLSQYCQIGSQAQETEEEFNLISSSISFILSASKNEFGIILDGFGKVKEAFGVPNELLIKTLFFKKNARNVFKDI